MGASEGEESIFAACIHIPFIRLLLEYAATKLTVSDRSRAARRSAHNQDPRVRSNQPVKSDISDSPIL